MSVYNGEEYLDEAINSILNQTFKDYEFLIINDGSTDSSRDIILSYNDSRITLIDNEENIGLTSSLNKGLRHAKGIYIARMDADDVSLPQRLEMQSEFLGCHPEVILLGSWAEIIDGEGKTKDVWEYPTSAHFIAWKLLFGNCLVHSAVMYRKDSVLKTGGYNEHITYAQDYELWIRLSGVGKIRQLPEVLVKCRKFITGSIEQMYSDKQLETARSAAFDYAKRIVSEIDYDTFIYFFSKTTSDKLRFHAIRKIIRFTNDITGKFLKMADSNHRCQREIIMDIRNWLKKWAMNNWRNPLTGFYLIVSLILITNVEWRKKAEE